MLYVGFDISGDFFHCSIIKNPKEILVFGYEYSNTPAGFRACDELIGQWRTDGGDPIICMENTGVYSENCAYFFKEHGYRVYVEHPLSVKRALQNKAKTDEIDSRDIAIYAYRYEDTLHKWTPKSDLVQHLTTFLSFREVLSQAIVRWKNIRKAYRRKHIHDRFVIDLCDSLIAEAKESLGTVDAEMKKRIRADAVGNALVRSAMSVPGVGFLLAISLYVVTHGFTLHLNFKEVAAYIGIVPYPHRSGTSVYSAPRSDRFGPSRLRKLLYLAALSCRQHDPLFKAYYERKKAEGKAGRLVLNNMANKLLKIIFAVVASGGVYQTQKSAEAGPRYDAEM